jgi:hypothetical protein
VLAGAGVCLGAGGGAGVDVCGGDGRVLLLALELIKELVFV